jgi:hypothetical protein
MGNLWTAVAALFAAIGLACSARANVITIDFNEIAEGTYFENVSTNGFRVSPSCHIDVYPYETPSNVMGFDTSGCLAAPNFVGNPDYIGQVPLGAGANVRIDMLHQPFSLLSFDYYGARTGTIIRSSKGGYFEAVSPTFGDWFTFSLNGSDWLDIEWIEISGECAGSPCRRLDNIAMSVPEPGTLSLLALTAIALVVQRRRVRPDPSVLQLPGVCP